VTNLKSRIKKIKSSIDDFDDNEQKYDTGWVDGMADINSLLVTKAVYDNFYEWVESLPDD